MIHLFDRIEIFDTVSPAPRPRPIRTPGEITQTRAFDKKQHIRDMEPAIWISSPLTLYRRNQRGPLGIFRRRKVVPA